MEHIEPNPHLRFINALSLHPGFIECQRLLNKKRGILREMKFFSFALCFLLVCISLSQKGIAGNDDTKSRHKIPVLDKEKQYPIKSFEPEAEETYICLETSKDVLLDNDAHIYYVSDKRILITNALKGDVFIFDMNGKVLSHFNQKGGYGYVWLSYALYDEPNNEIFIADGISRKIFVFTEEGGLKRTLHLPLTTKITEIFNFDENSLLAFHEHYFGKQTQEKPYLFISKKDGSILARLNISTKKANPRVLSVGSYTDKNTYSGTSYTIGGNFFGSCKFGQDFILANMSCDTIYRLQQDKSLTPLFVQYPTVFSDPPVITCVGMVTDDFVMFSVFPYDLKEARRKAEANEKQDGTDIRIRDLIYEFKTDQFFELEKRRYWAEKVDVPSNTSVELMQPYALKAWLKRGYLKGELKEIATKVDITDNPVVKITKFK